ncbi:LAFA_0G22672g1_1 [Lachancea sp. 'fantastica']|nr:LAFA_0G22672g1_1 [Lachancea sp. 'fantastica']
MSGVKKKKARHKTLQNLKGALQGLLQVHKKSPSSGTQPVLQQPDVVPSQRSAPVSLGLQHSDEQQLPHANEVVYVMSKESQLIPKLTDEQVLERHKRADENMKRAWLNLIEKYESIEDQGDVVDLTTGEIIEDNGHVRGLNAHPGSTVNASDSNYVSVLSDLIEIDNTATNIWKDNENDNENENENENDIESDYVSEIDSEASPTIDPH